MSFKETDYPAAANLVGNVDVPRNVLPMVRSGKRCHDPDGTSAAPYYAGVAGKVLHIEYTTNGVSVTPAFQDITLSSNSLATIVAEINAADASNLLALDLDGFLALKNLNPGRTHYIYISSDGGSAEAGALLGFALYPLPGSASYAGEVAASPGNRSQQNPQATTLLAKDETLSTGSINRGFSSILNLLEDLRAEMSRDVIGYVDVDVTFENHPSSGERVCRLPAGHRVFYLADDEATIPALEPYFRILKDGDQQITTLTDYPQAHVTDIYYDPYDDATDLDPDAHFVTWGTPDGKSINYPEVANLNKHASVAITSIVGNVVYCSTATFVTKKVKPGDPVQFTAATTQPFDHSGWFIVDGVVDETHLVVRKMALVEAKFAPDDFDVADVIRPLELNPAAGGTLRVAMGRFIPSDDLTVQTNDTNLTTATLRMAVGVPFHRLGLESQVHFPGSLSKLSKVVYDHITDTSSAHAAASIGSFTPTTSFFDQVADPHRPSGTNLRELIESIIQMLGSYGGTFEGGSNLVGAAPVTLVGSPAPGYPNTLQYGSVRSQVIELLGFLSEHVNDGVAHAGAGATYSGSLNWADGTNIPSGITIDAAIDQVVSDLAATTTSDDGAGKVGVQTRPAWLGGRTNSATDVYHALKKIIDDLGDTSALDDGAERIGAQLTSDLAAGSVRSQLDALSVGWGKLTRTSTWSATQIMNASASDTTAVVQTTYVPTTRKLIWEAALESSGAGNNKFRIYAGRNDVDVGFEVTINARWDGTNWNKDGTGQGTRLVLISNGMYLQSRLSGDSSPWTDTLGNWHAPMYFSAEFFASTTGIGASVTPKNVCRAQAKLVQDYVVTTPRLRVIDGFNIASATLDTAGGVAGFVVTFATALSTSDYVILPNTESSAYGWVPWTITDKSSTGFKLVPKNALNSMNNFTDFTGTAPTGLGGVTMGFAVFGN